jgi:hypothetical protein
MAALGVATVLAVAGCGSPAGSSGTPARSPDATTTAARTANAVPFDLSTHCGVDEAKFEGRYYEAVQPIPDGDPALRKDWDDPRQRGTMRAVSPVEAEFRDSAGHVVLLRLRPQATSFKRLCK